MRNLKRLAVLLFTSSIFVVGWSSAASASEPTVNQVSQSGTHLQIFGQHLGRTTAVLFQDTPAASFEVASRTEVDVTAPDLPVGRYSISLVAASGSVDTSIPYVVSPPAPAITSLSRTSGTTAGGDTIVVKGTNLSFVRTVSVGGYPKTYSAVSDDEVDIVTNAHSAGLVTLSITTLGGTVQRPFMYTDSTPGAINISSATPNHGYVGGNKSVTIKGSGFTGVNSVKFADANAKSFSVVSDSEITAVTPSTTQGGLYTLSVSNGTTSATAPWTYDYVIPQISEASLSRGVLTIDGSGFTGVYLVKVGDTTLTVQSLTDSQIKVTAPEVHGVVSVTVENPAGVSNAERYRSR